MAADTRDTRSTAPKNTPTRKDGADPASESTGGGRTFEGRGGYVYEDMGDKGFKIVKSPRGKGGTIVAKNSEFYDLIAQEKSELGDGSRSDHRNSSLVDARAAAAKAADPNSDYYSPKNVAQRQIAKGRLTPDDKPSLPKAKVEGVPGEMEVEEQPDTARADMVQNIKKMAPPHVGETSEGAPEEVDTRMGGMDDSADPVSVGQRGQERNREPKGGVVDPDREELVNLLVNGGMDLGDASAKVEGMDDTIVQAMKRAKSSTPKPPSMSDARSSAAKAGFAAMQKG